MHSSNDDLRSARSSADGPARGAEPSLGVERLAGAVLRRQRPLHTASMSFGDTTVRPFDRERERDLKHIPDENTRGGALGASGSAELFPWMSVNDHRLPNLCSISGGASRLVPPRGSC